MRHPSPLGTHRWRQLSRAVVDVWLREYGAVCPGYDEPAHRVEGGRAGLTVDHIVPRSAGGSDHPANLTVLCRRCNGRKGQREGRGEGGGGGP